MISWTEIAKENLQRKISLLYQNAQFVMAIRYYRYKVNLYLLGDEYIEVFINHKKSIIERIAPLDRGHTQMNFYSDQIKLRTD